MSIKLIAVDMDGTFLSDQKTYNRDRFMAQYQHMKRQGIRFVVASGNQYYQLISFFPEIAHEIAFVAENGGWVVSEGEDIFNGELTKADFQTVVEHLLTRADVEIIACGKNSAYTLKRYNDALKAVAAMYYHRLEFVDNFNNINDVFFKFGLNITDERIPEVQAALHDAIGDIMVPVHTGYGSIDLIIPGVHKANGLRLLQQRWGIHDSEVVVFGDGGNDIEMLRQAGFSFAMSHASEAVAAMISPATIGQPPITISERTVRREVKRANTRLPAMSAPKTGTCSRPYS